MLRAAACFEDQGGHVPLYLCPCLRPSDLCWASLRLSMCQAEFSSETLANLKPEFQSTRCLFKLSQNVLLFDSRVKKYNCSCQLVVDFDGSHCLNSCLILVLVVDNGICCSD